MQIPSELFTQGQGLAEYGLPLAFGIFGIKIKLPKLKIGRFLGKVAKTAVGVVGGGVVGTIVSAGASILGKGPPGAVPPLPFDAGSGGVPERAIPPGTGIGAAIGSFLNKLLGKATDDAGRAAGTAAANKMIPWIVGGGLAIAAILLFRRGRR